MDADDNDNEKQQRRMMVVMKLKQLHTTITNYNYHKLNRGHHKKFLFSDKVLHIAKRSQKSNSHRIKTVACERCRISQWNWTYLKSENYHILTKEEEKKSDAIILPQSFSLEAQLSTKNRTSSTNSKRRASYESATDMLRLQSEPSALQVDMLGTHMQNPALLCFPV